MIHYTAVKRHKHIIIVNFDTLVDYKIEEDVQSDLELHITHGLKSLQVCLEESLGLPLGSSYDMRTCQTIPIIVFRVRTAPVTVSLIDLPIVWSEKRMIRLSSTHVLIGRRRF